MSAFGSFKFGSGDRFGSPEIDSETLAIARSIMSRFHSSLVINKDTEDTLQFRYVLAFSRAIRTLEKEALATYNDNFLGTSREEHIDAMWGILMNVPYDNSLTLAENIERYQGIVKTFLTGSAFLGLTYAGTHVVNIVVMIYLFTKITNVRIRELWRDAASILGGEFELFEIGALDPDSQSFFGGAALLGPAGGHGRSGLIPSGAQIIVPLDNFVGANTDGVLTAKELLRPVMSALAVVYELSQLFPGGVDPGIVSMAFGRGELPLSPLPTDLAFEVVRVPVFQTYTDSNWMPVPYATKYRRYFAVVNRELIFGLVPITEAALLDGGGSIIMYRTFSAVNKTNELDVLMAWNVDFT